MAVRAILTSVPPEVYQLVKARSAFEPNAEVLGGKYDWQSFDRVSIDTAWYELHTAFSARSPDPLVCALQGDYCPAGGLDLFSSSSSGDSYLAYVSPETARAVSLALAAFDAEKALRDSGRDADDLNYCLQYYWLLAGFYRRVAQRGSAVFISIG